MILIEQIITEETGCTPLQAIALRRRLNAEGVHLIEEPVSGMRDADGGRVYEIQIRFDYQIISSRHIVPARQLVGTTDPEGLRVWIIDKLNNQIYRQIGQQLGMEQ